MRVVDEGEGDEGARGGVLIDAELAVGEELGGEAVAVPVELAA